MEQAPTFEFPGRWVGGGALVLGPLLLLAGVLTRLPFDFFFPDQLLAYRDHPARIVAAYSLFAVGTVVMAPAVVALAARIGRRAPGWAVWGGMLALAGLFARTFSAGIDHLAFQLVDVQSLELATEAVADSYGAWYVLEHLVFTKMFGWLVLAVGAYRARALPVVQCVALALMGGLMGGTLKGSNAVSVVATAGLCVALVPLGARILLGRDERA